MGGFGFLFSIDYFVEPLASTLKLTSSFHYDATGRGAISKANTSHLEDALARSR